MESLHIHLMGPPGVGKSALAHAITAKLKLAGESVEMVQEYAKELLWDNQLHPSKQSLTTSEQIRREDRLRGKVAIIVTDSPPILGVIYANPGDREPLRQAVNSLTSSWTIAAYLLDRDFEKGYEQRGRKESPVESRQKGRELEQLLIMNRTPFKRIDMAGGPGMAWDIADVIIDQIIERLEEMHPSRSRRPLRELRIPPRDVAASAMVKS